MTDEDFQARVEALIMKAAELFPEKSVAMAFVFLRQGGNGAGDWQATSNLTGGSGATHELLLQFLEDSARSKGEGAFRTASFNPLVKS